MINLLTKYKQSSKDNALRALQKEAESSFAIKPFENALYFTFNGVPFESIANTTSSSEILQKLYILRENFLKVRTQQLDLQ